MPLSTLKAGLLALVVGIGNTVIALGLIGTEQATLLETAVVGVISAVFVLANAIIHHGVTRTEGTDASRMS